MKQTVKDVINQLEKLNPNETVFSIILNLHLTNTITETFVRLSEDQMDLILYCLEQMESDFNKTEQSLCEAIIDTFTDALVEINSQT
jgi:hypothetical protein